MLDYFLEWAFETLTNFLFYWMMARVGTVIALLIRLMTWQE
jgi:hypothetical protein